MCRQESVHLLLQLEYPELTLVQLLFHCPTHHKIFHLAGLYGVQNRGLHAESAACHSHPTGHAHNVHKQFPENLQRFRKAR